MTASNRLAVNIGNSRIACGFFSKGELKEAHYYALSDVENATRQLITFTTDKHVTDIALSSVVPPAADIFIGELTRHKAMLRLFNISSDSQTLLRGLYKGLGADRIANAAAAHKLHSQSGFAIVIDFGSATTLTAVGATGDFLGGWITLGLGKSLSHINASLALLPDVQGMLTKDLSGQLGMNTTDAILQGTVLAQAATTDAWISAAKNQLGDETRVIATGGYAGYLSAHCRLIDEIDPQLTLKGIEIIAEAAMDRADRA